MTRRIYVLILTLFLSLAISSCLGTSDMFNYYVEGDFVFAYKEFRDGIEQVYLYGLSEEGQKKECIVLPKEYNDKKINGFGVELASFYGGKFYKDDFDSSVLEKIFIDFDLSYVYDNFFNISGENPNDGTNPNVNRNKYKFIIWYYFDSQILNDFSFITDIHIFGNNLLNNPNVKKYITYDAYQIANVSYIYNYEEAPNDGYYWVDNYDNKLIDYIPPEPIREGYKFDGWYKEKECINQWDFTCDKTSASYTYYEKPNENSTKEYIAFYKEYISVHTYLETKLYAKWEKIDNSGVL